MIPNLESIETPELRKLCKKLTHKKSITKAKIAKVTDPAKKEKAQGVFDETVKDIEAIKAVIKSRHDALKAETEKADAEPAAEAEPTEG